MTYVAMLLITCVQGGVNTTLSAFLKQFDLSLNQIGYFVALMGTMRLVSRIPTDAIYAPSRGKRILFLVLPLMAAAQIGYAGSKGPFLALLSTVIVGATQGISSTVLMALTIDLKPENRSSDVIMGWFAAAIAAGFVISNFGTGFLADQIGFRATFLVLSLFPWLAMVSLALLSVPESEEKPHLGQNWPRLVTKLGHLPTHWRRWVHNVHVLDFGVLAAALIGFQMSFVGHAIAAFFPLLALGAGLNLTEVGLLLSTASLSSFCIRPLAFLLFRISGYMTTSVIGVLLSSLAVMLLPGANLAVLFGLFVIVGLARGANRVAGAAIVAEKGSRRGIAVGVFNAGLDMGALSAPAVAGWLASWVGVSDMFRLLPVLLTGFFLLALITSKRTTEAGRVAVTEEQKVT
jgi:MFS family permease